MAKRKTTPRKAKPASGEEMRTERLRGSLPGLDKKDIVRRVKEFAEQDEASRSEDRELRLQRYAKFRMWVSGETDFPWEGSSNIGLPMLMTDVLALEDSLHNAVMSNRPLTSARALLKGDEDKQDDVDDLLDTQVFIEQDGEESVGEAASCFVLDGVFTAFTPWVRENRKMAIYRNFKGFGDDIPAVHFKRIIEQEFPDHPAVPMDDEQWDWKVTDPDAADPRHKDFEVKFYTSKDTGEIEMVTDRVTRVYDGPKIIIKDYEEVLTPPRSANVQAPGPKNPGGAAHVILIDYPTVDEIERLKQSGFYDLVTEKDIKAIRGMADSHAYRHEEAKQQKDVMQGETNARKPDDDSHAKLTRYLCFDLYDIDGDGVNTDMMWWVLAETDTLLKAKKMTEMYPADPPRRPLAEACMIPVKGRREGIGLLEMMESMHDLKKELLDRTVDAGTIGNLPFFFYRATSNIKPEVMRLGPGDGFPVSDVQRDISFPSIGSGNATSYGLNMMSVADQMAEKLTVRGDLQLGRVPVGRSSALRTSGNMQSLLQAGEARPERILRRFLKGWIEIFKQIHEMDREFLPDEKEFRIIGIRDPNDDPYRKILAKDMRGRFDFDFSINVLNANKLAQQEGFEKAMPALFNPVALQTGIVTPDSFYRLLRDYLKSLGFGNGQYINPPSPEAMKPPILAEEAITSITFREEMPEGLPLEGAKQHLAKLKQFTELPEFGLLDTPNKVALFRSYLMTVGARARTEQLAAAAAQQGPGGPGGGPGPGGPLPSLGQPPVNEGELLDETLPGAGGGANPNGGMQ